VARLPRSIASGRPAPLPAFLRALRPALGPVLGGPVLGGLVLGLAVTFTGGVARAEDGSSLAMAVKATFLYKFPLYVTWPERAFAAATSPFTLCIVGDEAFAALVERAARGQAVDGHPIAVVAPGTPAGEAPCRVVFVATADPGVARAALAAVAGLPVLTVTDGMADPAAQGMINFVIAAGRVRFAIDEAQAARSGLSVSSKLLSLAVAVRPAR
jgi:hypothetical protein